MDTDIGKHLMSLAIQIGKLQDNGQKVKETGVEKTLAELEGRTLHEVSNQILSLISRLSGVTRHRNQVIKSLEHNEESK